MERTASNRQAKRRWLRAAVFASAAFGLASTAAYAAGTDINTTVNQSALVCDPTFDGGTLTMDAGGTTTCNFTVNNFVNTIDEHGNNSTLSGVLSGTGGLTFTDGVGGGSVTLTNIDSYVGVTTINSSAIVKLSGAGSLSSSSSISDNGIFNISGITGSTSSIVSLSGTSTGSVVLGSKTLNLTEATDIFTGDISGAGNLKISDGAETLDGVNEYTGTTTIASGATLDLSSGSISDSIGVVDNGLLSATSGADTSISTLSGNGAVTTYFSHNLVIYSASSLFSGAINGGGGLEISGGTEQLTGANSYTGATTIDTGAELLIGNAPTSISTSSGVTVNGTGVFDVTTAGATIKSLSGDGNVYLDSQTLKLTSAGGATFSGDISGSGGNLTIHSGTETLTGTNGYSGDTIIDGSGVLALSGSGDISASDVVTDNGVFDISQETGPTVSITSLAGSFTSHVYLGANTLELTSASGTYNGIIADAGGLNSVAGGGLEIASGAETLGNAETYTGHTTIDSGAYLHLSGAGSLADSSVVDNGTLDISVAGGSSSIKSLSGTSTGKVTLGGNLLMINDGAGTFNGVISGAGGSVDLSSLSSFVETFTGTNTYTGATIIESAAELDLSGTGSISASSGVEADGTFDISNLTNGGTSIKTLSGASTGDVELGANTLTLTAASTEYDGEIHGTGGLTLNSIGGTETLGGTGSDYSGTTTITTGTLKAGVADTFSPDSAFVLAADSSAILNLNSFDQTIYSLSGGTFSPSGDVQLGSAMLTITNGGTFNGTITGTGQLDVGGTGSTFTLTGGSTYTGQTTIESTDTLALTLSGNIGSSSVVADAGTFDISGVTSGSASIKSLSGAGGVTLGSKTLNLTAANDIFSGDISGTGGLTLSAGGEELSNVNDYTGATSISPGATLYLTGSGSITGSAVTVSASPPTSYGTLDISGISGASTSIVSLAGNGNVVLGGKKLALSNASGSFSGVMSGSGGQFELAGGTETLAGINTYTGATTIDATTTLKISGSTILASSGVADAGTLDVTLGSASIKTLSGAGAVAVGSQTLTLTNASSTFLGLIGTSADNGGLSITGGSETLTGASLYNGTTTIGSTATLVLSGSGSIVNSRVADSGTLDVSGGSTSIQSLSGSGSVLFGFGYDLTLSNASDTFSGIISGGDATSTFEIGGGSETLTNANTYTGTTQIDSGAQLSLSGTGSIADSSEVTDNGTFSISGTTSGASIVTLSGSGIVQIGAQTLTLTSASDTFSGNISGTTGALTIAGGSETLTGSQTYGGLTTIDSGATLTLGSGGTLSLNSGVEDEGSFVLSANTTIKSLTSTLANPGTVTLNTYTLTINNASGIYYGDIGFGGDTGGLTIAGGTQTLAGTNEYTGATIISSGATLAITGATSVDDSSGVVAGGTFDISGTTAGTSIQSLSGSSGSVVLGGKLLTIDNASGSFGGVISGSGGGIDVTGGTETLSGVNTYTGATSISSGATLAITGAGKIATSSGVADDGTFDISGASSGTIVSLSGASTGVVTLGSTTLTLSNASGSFAGAIGGTGGLTISGTGSETLTGVNGYSGITTIASGAMLTLSGSGSIANSNVADSGLLDVSGATAASIKSLSGSGNVAVGANTLIITNGVAGAAGNFSGVIDDATLGGGLEISGGTETLQAVNTYSGATTIDPGAILKLSNSGNISASSGVADSGTFDISLLSSGTSIQSLSGAGTGSVALGFNTLTITNGGGTFSGIIGGTGGFTVSGGTETLGGTNTYTGLTTISGGTLALTGTGSIATSSGVADNGGFDISQLTNGGTSIATLSGSGNGFLGANTLTLTAANSTFSGIIADGGISPGSPGSLTVSAGTETLSGANTFTGTTTIASGAHVVLSGSGSLASSVADNGVFNISAITPASTAIASLSGASTGVVTLGSKTLELSNAAGTFAGIIGGTGGLTIDTGTETLTGANTYSGATTITGGTLALTGTGSISNSSDVDAEGTFDISGLTNSGTSISTLSGSGTGALVLGANTLTFTGANSTFSGSVTGTGGITVTGGTEKFAGTTSYSGTTSVGAGAFLYLLNSGDASSAANINGTLNFTGATGGVSLASLTGSGSVVLDTHTLTLTAASDNYSGTITGTGGLTISGGSETLSSADNYGGATTINSGASLTLAGGGAVQFSSGVQDDGTFVISSVSGSSTSIKSLSGASTGVVTLGTKTLTLTNATGTFAGVIGGTGGLSVNGTGTETLSGINTFSGAATIGSGETVALTGAGSIVNASVADTGTLDISLITASGTTVKSLAGSGIVTLGGKTLTLSNTSGSFSGSIGGTAGSALDIEGGTFALTGGGTISATGGVTDNATFNIASHTGNVSITTLSGNIGTSVVLGNNTLILTNASGDFEGDISGTGGLEIAAGTETLSGTNDYSGATTIDSGATLIVTGSLNVASTIINNGTFTTTGAVSTGVLNGSGNLGIGTSLTLTGPGVGNYSGVLSGVGNLFVGNGTHAVDQTFTNAETYTGTTTIASDGILRLASSGTDGSISTSSLLTDNGVFDISGLTNGGTSIVSLAGSGSVTLGANTLTLTTAADTFSGIIGGTGGLTVAGGTETLSGANTYNGATTISSGATLDLTGAGSIASSAVADAGTLDISGTTTGASIKSLSGAGGVTLGAKTLTLANASDTYSGNISGTGGLTISSGSETLSGNNALTGTTSISSLATLQLGDGTSANGSVGGNITDNGALKFDYTGSATYGGAITGSGSLTQMAGTTILTANDNYSGGTTITAGTLQLGNGGANGAITGNVADSGTLAFNHSGTVTFAGNVTGSGGVTQLGGTTILTGTDGYTGATLISSGTLQIGNGGTTGSIGGTSGVTDNATLAFDRSDAVSFGAAISGSGGLTQEGAGTLTLTNTETYSGATTISSGTLALSGASIALSSGVADSGTFDISANGATAIKSLTGAGGVTLGANTLTLSAAGGTFSGVASGTGGGLTLGGGSETLTGDNTYTGVTTISAGTLNLGDGSSTSGSVAGNITDNAALTFDYSGTATYGGAITGTGNVSLLGGTLVLTGDSNYGGGTTITSGTLQLGNGGAHGSITGNILDNDALVFDTSANETYGGTISGSGSVEQAGSGTTTLGGTNSYGGGTTISSGALSISSDANLGTGGTLVMEAGTTLDVTATGSFAHNVTLAGDPNFNITSGTTTTWTGEIDDGASAGELNVIGGGTLALTNASNSYSGGTAVSGGSTLTLTADGEIGNTAGGLTLGDASTAGTLKLGASFNLASTRALSVGAGGGTIDTNTFNTTVSQAISGLGGLTKAGTGTLTLLANNTYSGATTVSGGSLQLGNGTATTGSVAGDITDNAALAFDYSGTATYGGAITGTGSVSLLGGTLVLTGDSNYGGGTTITSGTLQLGNGGATGSITGNILDNAALAFDATGTHTYNGNITGSGSVTQSAGTTVLGGTNTYGGGTNINGGTLSVSADTNLGTGGTIAMANGSTLAVTATNSFGHAVTLAGTDTFNIASGTTTTWTGLLSSSGALDVTGGGTLALTNTNTYSGGTTVAGGSTLLLTSDSELGNTSGSFALGDASTGGTLKLGSSINLASTRAFSLGAGGGTINTNTFNTTVSQAISGSGGLTKAGTGTLTLTAANTYTGSTTISGGTLQLTGAGSIATSSSVADNGILDATAAGASLKSLSGNGSLAVASNTLTITAGNSADVFSGVISGSGGKLTISGGTETLSGTNIYNGATSISSGATLALSGTGSILASSGVADNGTFDISLLTNGGTSIKTLSGSGDVVLGSNTLTLTAAADTFSGVISGDGGLTIAGGTETLTGTNTYTGDTTIDGGATLILTGTGSISSGSTLNIASGGTFDASGSSATSTLGALSGSGNLVLGSGGLELTGGTGTYTGSLSGAGGLTIDGGVDETLTGDNTYSGATIIDEDGSLTLTGTGSIADSSGVTDNGDFDISGLTNGGTSITSLSGSGTVELGSNTLTLSDATSASPTDYFSGMIQGDGGLEVANGTETLTGTNTYGGGTTIDHGATLQLGDGTGTNGSIAGGVTDNGTLAFDYDGSASFGGAITGSGDVSILGGAVTLTGTNDYTGGTTIGGDTTLIVAGQSNVGTGDITMDAGSSLDITGTGTFANNVTVTGDPTFNVASGTTTTWSGLISGAGDLVATGGGTLALTNASNSYSLGTIVEGGSTLSIAADGDIGDTAGGLTLGDASTTGTLKLGASFNLASTRAISLGAGGGVIDTNTFNTTVSQAISGLGGLTKVGTGTLTLAADNNYGGGTTVSAGTLQLGDGTSVHGSVTGNILDNAALAFDYSGTAAAYSGVISGSGTVTQTAGTTVLTGANLYTGSTTITAGTLQIGNGGITGSIDTTSGVTDSGTLAFDRSDAVTFAGLISGGGGLTQMGSGTLTLTANNGFTGTTTISAGTLDLGGGGTTGTVGGNITDNAALVFDRSNADTYAGAISGSGTLTQAGTGTLTLTGTSALTGATAVNAGTLVVNGSLAHSAVTVNTGTALEGTGTVGSTTIGGGAILSPGVGGVGTLNVSGNIAFAGTSNFAVDVSGGATPSADKVVATGTATISGGSLLTVNNLGGSYLPGQQFTLLTASGGVTSDAFDLVGDNNFGTNLTALLIYPDADDVVLQLKLKDLLPILATDSTATRNETSVITAIDTANDAGDTLPASFINLPSLSSGALASAADQLSGEVGAAAPQVASSLMNPFMTTMFDHITSLSIGNDGTKAGSVVGPGPMPAQAASYAGFRPIHDKLGLWLSAFGGDGSTTGVSQGIGTTDVNTTTAGVAGGLDFHVSPHFVVGLSGMGGHSSFDLSGDRGKGSSNAFEGGLYGLVHGTGFYVAAAGAYSSQDMSTDRTVVIPSVTPTGGDHLSASFTAQDYGARLETGVYVNWLTPYVAVQTLSFHSPAYSEKAVGASSSDFALAYDANSMTTTRFELGTGFGTDMRVASNSIVNLWGRLGWAHDINPDQKADVSFAGLPDSGFTVYGAQPSADSALVSLGAQVKGRNGFDMMARVDADISGISKTYIGTLGFNYTW